MDSPQLLCHPYEPDFFDQRVLINQLDFLNVPWYVPQLPTVHRYLSIPFFQEEETLAHFRPNLFLSLVRLIKGYCLCNRLGLPEATDSFYNIIFEEEFIQADRELKRHLITKNIRSFTVNNE